MSLTAFLRVPDVRIKFKEEFAKPSIKINKELLAPKPIGANGSLVGSAFDYLLRFYIEYINPQVKNTGWVAEYGLCKLQMQGFNRIFEEGKILLEQAVKNYDEFQKNGEFTDELIKSSLILAKLDLVVRCNYIDENMHFINPPDVEDLKKLTNVIDPNIFKSQGNIILNPSWGEGSLLVGGADGDLIMDDLLVEFKTIQEPYLKRRDFNQLLGYYIIIDVYKHFNPKTQEINRLGIYFSRYGYLYQFNVSDIASPAKFKQVRKWFVKRALAGW